MKFSKITCLRFFDSNSAEQFNEPKIKFFCKFSFKSRTKACKIFEIFSQSFLKYLNLFNSTSSR